MSGHDFSRAEKAHKIDEGFSPRRMYFASSSENTGLFPQPAEPPRHVLPSFPRPTPNPKWKESLETPPPPAMHPHQALLHGDCFTLRNLPRAAGVHRGEFISPAFHRLLRNCHCGLSLRGIESLSARVSGRHKLAPVARLGLPERQNIPSPLQRAKEKNCSRNTQFCNSLCGSG